MPYLSIFDDLKWVILLLEVFLQEVVNLVVVDLEVGAAHYKHFVLHRLPFADLLEKLAQTKSQYAWLLIVSVCFIALVVFELAGRRAVDVFNLLMRIVLARNLLQLFHLTLIDLFI